MKIIEKVYDDVLSGAAKEIGGISADLVKVARLILSPIQIGAAYQDRLRRMVERIAIKVPEERRVEPQPEVIGPALEQMKYLDDRNPLWCMFEELFCKSIDEDNAGSVHPSFTHIISQLSRDEALILWLLSDSDFQVTDYLDFNRAQNRFENRQIEEGNLPTKNLFLPNKLDLYYSHLESLNLVAWPVYKQEPVKDSSGIQIGLRRYSRMHLTEFGKLFAAACIPTDGFSEGDRNES